MLNSLAIRMAQLGLLTKPISQKDKEMLRARYCVFVGDHPFEYAIYLNDYPVVTDEIILSHLAESQHIADKQIV